MNLPTRKIDECPFCAIIGAHSVSETTEHHLIPQKFAVKYLGRKIKATIPLCEEHHKLFNLLTRPHYYLIENKLQAHKFADWVEGYLIPHILKNTLKIMEKEA